MKSVKFGRNWVTKKEWLDEYLQKILEIERPKFSLRFSIDITPKIRFGFLIVLVLVMISSGIVFGKDSFKNVLRDLDFAVTKFGESTDLAAKEIFGSTKNVITLATEGGGIVFQDLNTTISTAVENVGQLSKEGAVISAGDLFGSMSENLKEFSQWLGRLTFGGVQEITQGYTKVNNFTEQKLSDLARQTFEVKQKIVHPIRNMISSVPDFVRSVISNGIQGYTVANNFVEQQLGRLVRPVRNVVSMTSSFVKNIISNGVQKYLAANDFVEEKISQEWQGSKYLVLSIKQKLVEGTKGIPETIKNYGKQIARGIINTSRSVLDTSKSLVFKIEEKYLLANDFVEKRIVQGYKAFTQLFKAPERISEEKLIPKPAEEGLVVIPSTGKNEEVVKNIKESFSDEVKVEPTDKTSGIIIPVFKKGEGEKYLYILVPIKN